MKKKLRIDELTKAEKTELVKEICRICEKQYRKGYQQGFHYGNKGWVIEEQVTDFRLKGNIQNYSKVVYPPNFKTKDDPVSRILPELRMPDIEILNSLFSDEDEIRREKRKIKYEANHKL